MSKLPSNPLCRFVRLLRPDKYSLLAFLITLYTKLIKGSHMISIDKDNSNFSFDLLIKNNPVMKDKQGSMVYDKQVIGKIGEMRLTKIETLMVASFFFDSFGKDMIIFDISKIIGKDSYFSFDLQNGKVIQMSISVLNCGGNKSNETKFVRCHNK